MELLEVIFEHRFRRIDVEFELLTAGNVKVFLSSSYDLLALNSFTGAHLGNVWV